MTTKSIRFRLTLLYSTVLIVSIGVVFGSFFLMTRKILFDQTDISLTSHGNKVAAELSKKKEDMHKIIAQKDFINEFGEVPGMLVFIIDKGGMVISSSQPVTFSPGTFLDLYENAKQAGKPDIRNKIIGNTSMRFFASPIQAGNAFSGVVLVAHPIDIIQKSLNSLLSTLATLFFLLVIPTIFIGYLATTRALKPIKAISDKLRIISSENLAERVENPHTGDEIEELSHTFNNLLDRLSNAFQRERQFIGDIAHELKTPLSVLKSNIEVTISKERNREEYKKVLVESIGDIDNFSSTLKKVLDLAWSETGSSKSTKEILDLSKLVRESKDIAIKMAQRKEIAVEEDITESTFIQGNKEKLVQAILNIIDNAIKYTPKGGKISINLTKKQNQATIKIQDNGQGISQKDLPHIFDRFYRSRKVGQTEGSGLGLAIAQGIVLAHKGSISVKSNIDKGTKVTIFLPTVTTLS